MLYGQLSRCGGAQKQVTDKANAHDGGADGALDEYSQILEARAAAIKSVRNDIFNTKWWQLALNFLLGGAAVAGLIVSMTVEGTVGTVCTIVGVALIIIFVVYNFALRTVAPMSIMQYTRIENGKRYCFQILSKRVRRFRTGPIISKRNAVTWRGCAH